MSTDVTTAVGTFVWRENVSSDPQRAQDFYTQLFGWEIEHFAAGDFDYPMISANGGSAPSPRPQTVPPHTQRPGARSRRGRQPRSSACAGA